MRLIRRVLHGYCHRGNETDMVAARYDLEYAHSITVADGDLRFSLERLFRNYGVIDPTREGDSERLPIALQALGYPDLGGKIILDYGCGSGKSAVVFAQAGAEVYGFDIALNSIRIGRRRAKVNSVEKSVHLAVMAADRLGYPSGVFDLIYAYEVLYYLNGKIEFGDEILRVLKPGGRAVFCEALDGNPVLRGIRLFLRMVTGTVNRVGGRPLNYEEIQRAFGREAMVTTYPVNILGMAKRAFTRPNWISKNVIGFLKRWDRFLLVRFPGLRRWCGEVVIVITKNRLPPLREPRWGAPGEKI